MFEAENNVYYLNLINQRIKKLSEIDNIKKDNSDIESIISNLKPPVFWKDKPVYIQQLRKWSSKNLEIVLNKIGRVELLMKKNSQIRNDVLLKNLLINLCNRASSAV